MERRFKRDPNFNVSEYLKSSFRVMHGRHPHSIQKIVELPDGGSRVTLRVSFLDEVRPWVLEWEEHATVIAPEQLRRSQEKVAWALVDTYNRAVEEMEAWLNCRMAFRV